MSTSLTWREAEQFFLRGQSLFRENRYEQGLIELRRAERAFRRLDARGHLFRRTLSNGVSGLSNTLVLSGRCHQNLGNYEQAIACYETSLINATFERKKPFRAFLTNMRQELAVCYETELNKISGPALQDITGRDAEIDISFRFPFSLDKHLIPLARIYELAPDRFPQFRDLYVRSQNRDRELRRNTTGTVEAHLKKITVFVWVVLGALWAAYSLIVSKALFQH
jgi:tetratricopeptide (TPR) repeat protein